MKVRSRYAGHHAARGKKIAHVNGIASRGKERGRNNMMRGSVGMRARSIQKRCLDQILFICLSAVTP